MHSFSTRSILRHSAAAILAGALAASTIGLTPAQAAHHHHWHHGNAAVLGAVAGLFGTIAAVAAADRYRDAYYYDNGPYYDGYGGPYVYAPAYGGGYYHHWHHGYHGHHHH